ALAQSELDLSEYSALEIKRAVTGTGRATKEQVQHMIRVLLGMDRKPPQDAADALACAICHIHNSQGHVIAGTDTESKLQTRRRVGGR
ncbi:MAG: crossover junction endodeoxyribonuclease RuvC, partial [Proteobacteria bacterium]|nr:crossover junction endodeoxyribonuclease RuvC [Pseudomonadota bacterium]